jgi:alkylhydroperoxidase/carboxymuconolactone decarboxylase family protein YurZ
MQNSMYYTTSGLTSLPAYQGGGYLDQYGRQRYGLGKFVKKITKPVAKVLDKVVPNEIKPFLPYVAAAMPFMLGPTFSFGGLSAEVSRAIAAAGANAVSQLSQEGAAERGLNPISLGLSAAGGYLSTPGVGESLRAGTILGTDPTTGAIITKGSELAGQIQTTSPTFLQSAENIARGITSYGADTLSKGTESFQNIVSGTSPNVGKDLLTLGKAYVPGALQASGELAYNAALDANKRYEQEMLAMGNLASANKQDQINYIRRAMQSAGFNEDEIASAITRSGFAGGGEVESGLMSLRMGGMPVEMDLRKGGFVPLGKKERADDVPARLSKNEFVFTAKAVRNAGGGDVRKGAKRMYQIMNQLEARA